MTGQWSHKCHINMPTTTTTTKPSPSLKTDSFRTNANPSARILSDGGISCPPSLKMRDRGFPRQCQSFRLAFRARVGVHTHQNPHPCLKHETEGFHTNANPLGSHFEQGWAFIPTLALKREMEGFHANVNPFGSRFE